MISDYKNGLRRTLAGLARDAGLSGPDELGDTLLMLIDGANARVLVTGDRGAIRRAKAAAARLIKFSDRA